MVVKRFSFQNLLRENVISHFRITPKQFVYWTSYTKKKRKKKTKPRATSWWETRPPVKGTLIWNAQLKYTKAGGQVLGLGLIYLCFSLNMNIFIGQYHRTNAIRRKGKAVGTTWQQSWFVSFQLSEHLQNYFKDNLKKRHKKKQHDSRCHGEDTNVDPLKTGRLKYWATHTVVLCIKINIK